MLLTVPTAALLNDLISESLHFEMFQANWASFDLNLSAFRNPYLDLQECEDLAR